MEKIKISQNQTQENQSSQKGNQLTDKEVCETHGEYNKFKKGFTGKLIEMGCPDCRDVKIKEDERKKNDYANKILEDDRFREAEIPKRFQNLTIEAIAPNTEEVKDALETISGFLDTYPDRLKMGASGFLSGNCGTGKTMFACIMVSEIIKKGYSAKYTTAWKMIQEIRQGYKKNVEESIPYFVNKYIEKSFLVIDEVGVQHGTDDERVLLYQVIDGRYNEVKPTLLISNSKNPVEDGYLDLRTIDRLKDGGGFSISFNGESYRK